MNREIKEFRVERVLIEERLPVEREFYAGVVVDDSYKVKGPVLMFSTEDGVDIEKVATRSPEKVARVNVDILRGISVEDAEGLVEKLAVPTNLVKRLGKIVFGVYQMFRTYSARSAEVNPIILSRGGEVYAADCHVVFDEASVFKHPELGIEYPRDIGRPPN